MEKLSNLEFKKKFDSVAKRYEKISPRKKFACKHLLPAKKVYPQKIFYPQKSFAGNFFCARFFNAFCGAFFYAFFNRALRKCVYVFLLFL